jgi:putative polyhydroxyalkanoate system protein
MPGNGEAGTSMAKPVTVNIPHTLGKAEARRRIEQGFGSIQQGLAGMLSAKQTWQGDRLSFEAAGLGQTLGGRLDVLDDSVQIQIDLPEMLAALADTILAKLKQRTQKLLE